jgi:DNA-binding NarL/FixJ family response regulator
MRPITVLISDDHNIVRQGLRLLLEATQDIQIAGETENGQEAVAETKRLRPQVVLLDLAMPLLNGIEATRQIMKEVPSTKVLILSSYSDGSHVQQAIEAGAVGYLMKETAAEGLALAIREVRVGNAFFSPAISKGLLDRWRVRDSQSQPITHNSLGLTTRQMQILQLIAEGYPNKLMADMLSLKAKTVEKHRQALMNKLDIHKTAALTRYAVSSGVIEVNCNPNSRFAMPFTPHRMSYSLPTGI